MYGHIQIKNREKIGKTTFPYPGDLKSCISGENSIKKKTKKKYLPFPAIESNKTWHYKQKNVIIIK